MTGHMVAGIARRALRSRALCSRALCSRAPCSRHCAAGTARPGVARRPRKGGRPVTGVRTPAARRAPRPGPGVPEGPAGSPSSSFGIWDWARWAWLQLTSMRTALVLLFLLALGSVPGSVLPQEGIDPQAVQQYYAAHPSLAPLLARLSLFDVFASPWFAAIYLLLFASLAGCVIPRTFRLARPARQQPPQAPANLSRLPLTARHETRLAPDEALAAAAAVLSAKRFRLRTGDGWISAEKGYLREAGNLLFHLALLALLAAVCVGGHVRLQGEPAAGGGRLVREHRHRPGRVPPGPAVSAADLQPFTIALDSFQASYVTSGALRGQPSRFDALIRYSPEPGAPMRGYSLRVNHPLNVDGVRVFLIGHGYAPVFRVTDGTGRRRVRRPGAVHRRGAGGPHLRGRDQGAGRPPPAAGVRRGVPADRG